MKDEPRGRKERKEGDKLRKGAYWEGDGSKEQLLGEQDVHKMKM